VNNATNEIKNTLGTNSRITEAEDRINEVKNRMVEINEAERKKEKRIKRNEDNLTDLCDNVKRPNVRIIGVPDEDKKKNHEKIIEEIMFLIPFPHILLSVSQRMRMQGCGWFCILMTLSQTSKTRFILPFLKQTFLGSNPQRKSE